MGTLISASPTSVGSIGRIGVTFSIFTMGGANWCVAKRGTAPMLAGKGSRAPPPPPPVILCGATARYSRRSEGSSILDLHHGWRELVRGEAGHRANACRQGVARPTASSPSHLVRRDGTVLAEVRGE